LGQGLPELSSIFALWRVERVPGGRVITGRLLPQLDLDSTEVSGFLMRWKGRHSVRSGPHGWDVLLFDPAERRERWWLHALLLAITVVSTTVAGALLVGERPPIEFAALLFWQGAWLPVPVGLDPWALATGLPFGVSLVAVLALHEAGHYVAARRHAISVTPPFFIPFPPYVSIIGTLGAFIRLRSPVMSRNALLDVGVAGPILSFLASIPLVCWGLLHSEMISVGVSLPGPYLISFSSGGVTDFFSLGDSLAMATLARALIGFDASRYVLDLHPVAFAGWLGLFVTALNLLPLSQLDGGHILYAALGRHQRPLAWAFFIALVPLGFLWAGWWVWAVLVYTIGRGRIRHPAVFDAERGLTPARRVVAFGAAVLFALCFVPVPFAL
jgi:hypothetical protein